MGLRMVTIAALRRSTRMPKKPIEHVIRIEAVYKHIGSIMREVRLRRGWTGEQMAGKLGWSRPTIVNIENGRQRVTLHDVPRIARALGITIRSLLPADWTG